jgi:hypothetical protein
MAVVDQVADPPVDPPDSQRQDSGQQPERSHDPARQPAPARGGLIVVLLDVQ